MKLQNVAGADGRTFRVHCYAWRSEAPASYDDDRFHAHANARRCNTCRRYTTTSTTTAASLRLFGRRGNLGARA